jgi:hypothetical protein
LIDIFGYEYEDGDEDDGSAELHAAWLFQRNLLWQQIIGVV